MRVQYGSDLMHRTNAVLGMACMVTVGVLVGVYVYTTRKPSDPVPHEGRVLQAAQEQAPTTQVLSIGTATVALEVADTPQLRTRGLSGRTGLAYDTGLWFVFPQSGYHSFWMPDMYFAIDIIWFNEHLTVVDIKENATPDSYPEQFRPQAPARYVLEVPAGYANEKGFLIGNKGTISP